MEESKKGQVTLFIIIGIVILVSIIVITLQLPGAEIARPAIPTDSLETNIRQFLSACFENAVQSSIGFIEETGTFNPELDTIPFDEKDVAILVTTDQSHIPSLHDLEQQLAELALLGYEECEPDSAFPFPLFQDFGSAQSRAVITPRTIQFLIDVPTRITTGPREVLGLGSHTLSVPSPLFSLHQTAVAFAQELIQEPGSLPLNALADSPHTIYVHPLSGNQVVIRVVENSPVSSITPSARIPGDTSPTQPLEDSDNIAHSYSFGVQW